jgi:carbonic anhydrase
MNISDIIAGNKNFKKDYFKKYTEEFEDLVKNGQKPKALFIGCSDSRVVPTLITDTKPGDLFVVRNIGNFVPPFTSDDHFHGVSSAIQYAVSILNVNEIIVCGHSHCGACAALYQDLGDNEDTKHIKKWLSLGQRAKNYVLNKYNENEIDREALEYTEKVSIMFQLENLLTFPSIKDRVEKGEITIHGWYYKIETGEIEYYDSESNEYKILD